MAKYTFEEIKTLLLKSINEDHIEAELSLTFKNKSNEYMIIIYDDHCSFQRCGSLQEQSGEYNYKTLDELYKAQQIDNIILERDWNNIIEFECADFELSGYWKWLLLTIYRVNQKWFALFLYPKRKEWERLQRQEYGK